MSGENYTDSFLEKEARQNKSSSKKLSRSGSEYDIMKFVNDDESFNPRSYIKEKLIDLLQRIHPDPLKNTIDKDFEKD